jgi:hypothetical protein
MKKTKSTTFIISLVILIETIQSAHSCDYSFSISGTRSSCQTINGTMTCGLTVSTFSVLPNSGVYCYDIYESGTLVTNGTITLGTSVNIVNLDFQYFAPDWQFISTSNFQCYNGQHLTYTDSYVWCKGNPCGNCCQDETYFGAISNIYNLSGITNCYTSCSGVECDPPNPCLSYTPSCVIYRFSKEPMIGPGNVYTVNKVKSTQSSFDLSANFQGYNFYSAINSAGQIVVNGYTLDVVGQLFDGFTSYFTEPIVLGTQRIPFETVNQISASEVNAPVSGQIGDVQCDLIDCSNIVFASYTDIQVTQGEYGPSFGYPSQTPISQMPYSRTITVNGIQYQHAGSTSIYGVSNTIDVAIQITIPKLQIITDTFCIPTANVLGFNITGFYLDYNDQNCTIFTDSPTCDGIRDLTIATISIVSPTIQLYKDQTVYNFPCIAQAISDCALVYLGSNYYSFCYNLTLAMQLSPHNNNYTQLPGAPNGNGNFCILGLCNIGPISLSSFISIVSALIGGILTMLICAIIIKCLWNRLTQIQPTQTIQMKVIPTQV